jgi:hypothetical protein
MVEITAIKILPSAINIIDPKAADLLPKLRLVVVAGEPLSYLLFRKGLFHFIFNLHLYFCFIYL